MAGMLPGVEAARRRRVHHNIGIGITSSSSSSRRSSFSLFSPNSSSSSLGEARSRTYQDDEKLGSLARQARDRLDVKLKAQKKPLFSRNNSDHLSEEITRKGNARKQLRTEVYGSTRKIIGWAKLGWKSGEQEECAVCLDEFKVGENLVNLPCAHRFHSRCLVPWLHSNAHCPCCRISIFS